MSPTSSIALAQARRRRGRAASCSSSAAAVDRDRSARAPPRRRTARRAATAPRAAAPGRASACAPAARRAGAPPARSRSWRLRSLLGSSSSSPAICSCARSPAARPRRPSPPRAAPSTGVPPSSPPSADAHEGLGARPQRAALLARQPRRQRARRRAPAARTPARARPSTPSRRSGDPPGGSGSKRTCWQREAIVGSTSSRRSVSSSRCANDGGSSSVFSMRLAAWSFIVSTPSITNTRRVRLERRARRRRDDRLLDVRDEHFRGARRRDPGQVRVRRRAPRARAPRLRVGAPRRRAAPPRTRARSSACPCRPARGRGTRATGCPRGGSAGPSTAARVRVRVDAGQAAARRRRRGRSWGRAGIAGIDRWPSVGPGTGSPSAPAAGAPVPWPRGPRHG